MCYGREAVCAVRRYSCRSDQIQSYVRSRSQPDSCLDDEDVLEELQNHRRREAYVKPESGLELRAYSGIMSNITGSGIATVTVEA